MTLTSIHSTFKSADGRLIHPVRHVAVFRGKRNSSKGKTLIILSHYPERYLTAKQIHDYTGVSIDYLQQRLTFWYNIRYINRKIIAPAKGKPCYAYQIASRGDIFVHARIPLDVRNKYISEINDWRSKRAKVGEGSN